MIFLPESDNGPSLLPDLTSLLDVIFILLVFLLLTANVSPHLLEIDLPVASAPVDSIEPNSVTLGISELGHFSIDDRAFDSWREFTIELAKQIDSKSKIYGSKPQMLVAADKDVALDAFVKLASWLSDNDHSVAEIVVIDR